MAPSLNYHTPDEWEAIRPVFTRLYIVDGRKLSEVQAILEHHYNFTTTVKQCKTRITQWKLAKYNKERDLLHVLRRINEARSRNRHLTARSFGNPVTREDIEKHFRRKKPNFDSHDPDVEIPTSPTPSNISCISQSRSPSPEPPAAEPAQPLSEEQGTNLLPSNHEYSYNSLNFEFDAPSRLSTQDLIAAASSRHHDHTVSFPVHRHANRTGSSSDAHSALVLHSQLCRPMTIDPVERGFFDLRDLIDVDFAAISHNYPDWWKSLSNIATDFDDAQLKWMGKQHDQARDSYDKVLVAVTPYARMPSIALLQLISYLLSWTAYRMSKDLVQSLFAYLARLKNVNSDLSYMLGCLGNPDHASCAIALYQECVSKYLTTGQGANSMTVLRMNMKLCRHAFATDDQEPAWILLRDIYNLRTIYKESIEQLTTSELNEELEETLQLFEDRSAAKNTLEEAMSACNIDESTPEHFDIIGGTQQHSMCNFKLGLYAVAYKQARSTLICFRKLYSENDPRVASAKSLLNRAETLKNEVHGAGIDWPNGDFTDWNATAQYLSPELICGSPSNFPHSFTPRSRAAKMRGRRSFNSHQHSSIPRSCPDPHGSSIHEVPRHRSVQRINSWGPSDTASIGDDSAIYSPAFIDGSSILFATPASTPPDNLIFEIED